VEKYCRAAHPADDMAHAHCKLYITKATDTHSEYVKFIAFPRQQCLRGRASVLTLSYIASPVLLSEILKDNIVLGG
jgi:hypothetical protein